MTPTSPAPHHELHATEHRPCDGCKLIEVCRVDGGDCHAFRAWTQLLPWQLDWRGMERKLHKLPRDEVHARTRKPMRRPSPVIKPVVIKPCPKCGAARDANYNCRPCMTAYCRERTRRLTGQRVTPRAKFDPVLCSRCGILPRRIVSGQRGSQCNACHAIDESARREIKREAITATDHCRSR